MVLRLHHDDGLVDVEGVGDESLFDLVIGYIGALSKHLESDIVDHEVELVAVWKDALFKVHQLLDETYMGESALQ